ncbi:MAG: hypothetical protein CM15mP130_0330 [Verrucomicrobiota bacterium]|nr:MAG: hypothetical protein CM15mP130_0330 [Verrucomicrobiota bacterium]
MGLTPTETGRLKVRRQDDWIWTRALKGINLSLKAFIMDLCLKV